MARALPNIATNRRWNTYGPQLPTLCQPASVAPAWRQAASSTNSVQGAPCKLCLTHNLAATHSLASCRLLKASKTITNAHKEEDSGQEEVKDEIVNETYMDGDPFDVNDINQGVINKINNV